MVEYGKYRAGSELATGAFTSVYAAQKPGSSRAYAVKVLKPSPELWSEKEADRQVSAFLARAEVQQKAGRAGKKYWAPVYDMGRHGEGAYYVTHQYPLSIETLIDRKMVLRSAQLYTLTVRILRGLQALDKACGQAHGNLHPNNVLLDRKRGGRYAIHLDDPAVGAGIGERSSDLQALGALIQGLITHKPVDPNRDWTLNGLETFASLGSRAVAWREFCGKLLGVGTQMAFTDLPEVLEATKTLRPRSLLVTYGGTLAMVALAGLAVVSIMYPGHVRKWRNQLLHRGGTIAVIPATQSTTHPAATVPVIIHPATTEAIVVKQTNTGPDPLEEARKAEARKNLEAQRLAEQQRQDEAMRLEKARQAQDAQHAEMERNAAQSAYKLWAAAITPPPLKSELLRLAWTSCKDRWLLSLTKPDEKLKAELDKLGQTLADWERELPDPKAMSDLPPTLQPTAAQRREEVFRQLASALVTAPVGIPDALSPSARAAAKAKFDRWVKERVEASQLADTAAAVLKADPDDPEKERDTLAAIDLWVSSASQDAAERADLLRLRGQIKALPEQRAAKIAAMIKTARDHDNPAEGKQALSILANVLKLDPDNADAIRLKVKISSYYELPATLADCIKAAEAGSIPAARDLADRYLTGRGTAKDPAAAMKWLEPLAQQGDATAMKTLGDLYSTGPTADPAKALAWYDKAAAGGDASAMLGVGRMHAQTSPPEYSVAITWFKKAAEKGSPDAMSELAACYTEGHGTRRDPKEAARWYQKAADAGSVDAMYHMGKLAFETRDPSAMKWLRGAADAGNADAMHYIGSMYNVGLGVDQDYAKALAWYKKSADKGSVDAMVDLAQMYHDGSGVKQDYAQSLPWYQKAAQAGNVNAMFTLGVMYQKGQGVPADAAQALNFFRAAADAGNSNAMRRMASFYQDGVGVDKDPAAATKWRRMAEEAAAKGQ